MPNESHNSTALIIDEEFEDAGPSKAEAQVNGLEIDDKDWLGKRRQPDSVAWESEISDDLNRLLQYQRPRMCIKKDQEIFSEIKDAVPEDQGISL